jgi:hypothetical protein
MLGTVHARAGLVAPNLGESPILLSAAEPDELREAVLLLRV